MNTSWLTFLPHTLAALNAVMAVLVVSGYLAIRNGKRECHRGFMITALLVFVAFAALYAGFHDHVGNAQFAGQGDARTNYYFFLLSHVFLAVFNLPLILITLWRALRGRFDTHRTVARYTTALWLYISLSGVVTYWMAYHLYRP